MDRVFNYFYCPLDGPYLYSGYSELAKIAQYSDFRADAYIRWDFWMVCDWLWSKRMFSKQCSREWFNVPRSLWNWSLDVVVLRLGSVIRQDSRLMALI